MSNRIAYIDLAKGFCISIVMLFHIRGIASHELPFEQVLFSSCMLPPFFFIAGVFYNANIGFKTFLIKKTNVLLIPFVFFYLTTSVLIPNLLHYVFGMHFETVIGWPSLWAFIWPGEFPNIPLWFLWCLFVMEMLFFMFNAIIRHLSSRHTKPLLLLSCFSVAMIGHIFEEYFSTDFAYILKALQNLPFLCLGYITSEFTTHLQKILRRRKIFLFSIASLAVASLPMLILPLPSTMAGSIFYCLCGLAGSYFIISLSALINYLPLFNYLGRYSIIIVLTHGLIVRIGYPLFSGFSSCLGGYGSVFLFGVVMALSYLAIIPLLRVIMPHVTAQKPLLTSSSRMHE